MSFKIKNLNKPFFFINLELHTFPNGELYYTKKLKPPNNSVGNEEEGTTCDREEAEVFTCLEDATVIAERLKKEWDCDRIFIYEFYVEGYDYEVTKIIK